MQGPATDIRIREYANPDAENLNRMAVYTKAL
jgi:hypothetical protein